MGDDFEANQLAAEKKWGGQYVQFTAPVGNINSYSVSFTDVTTKFSFTQVSCRFEDESGMTWRAVLRRMRVLRAIEELAAGEDSVTTIAHRVGYTSLSAFNAGFRDLTGRTPTQYRATFRP